MKPNIKVVSFLVISLEGLVILKFLKHAELPNICDSVRENVSLQETILMSGKTMKYFPYKIISKHRCIFF